MMRYVGSVIAVAAGLLIIVPLVTRLVNVLFVPVIVGVGLYLTVRLINARLNRW